MYGSCGCHSGKSRLDILCGREFETSFLKSTKNFWPGLRTFLVYNDLAKDFLSNIATFLLIFIKLLLLLLFFSIALNLLFTTNLQYAQRGPSQRSGPPKLARGSLGDRKIWVVRGRKEIFVDFHQIVAVLAVFFARLDLLSTTNLQYT